MGCTGARSQLFKGWVKFGWTSYFPSAQEQWRLLPRGVAPLQKFDPTLGKTLCKTTKANWLEAWTCAEFPKETLQPKIFWLKQGDIIPRQKIPLLCKERLPRRMISWEITLKGTLSRCLKKNTFSRKIQVLKKASSGDQGCLLRELGSSQKKGNFDLGGRGDPQQKVTFIFCGNRIRWKLQ